MRDFEIILTAYRDFSAHIEDRIFRIEPSPYPAFDRALIQSLVRQKEINDHAYFCLVFFQFEDFVKVSFDRLVQLRLCGSRGVDRVAWERIKALRHDLLSMIGFLLPGNDVLYRRVKELYRSRNNIAHEAALRESVDMATVPDDLDSIADTIQATLDLLEAAP